MAEDDGEAGAFGVMKIGPAGIGAKADFLFTVFICPKCDGTHMRIWAKADERTFFEVTMSEAQAEELSRALVTPYVPTPEEWAALRRDAK